MLDFSPVREKEMTIGDMVEGLSKKDLRELTNEMVNRQLELIAGCTDQDVVYIPNDPDAYDPAAETEEEIRMAWTMGHVIVHTTASSEEAAFLAAELARGVPHRGERSRYEVYWETITSIKQCRERLEESRRMRLATLDVWPETPHLNNTFKSWIGEEINAIGRFLLGLMHDDSHLGQIVNIVQQSKAARS